MIETIPLEVILITLVALAAALVLLRFGKIILRWTLAFGVLAAVIVFGLTLLEHNRTTQQAVQVATVASAGAAGASFAVVLLTVLLLAAVGGCGFFWLRWRLTERQIARRRNSRGWLPGPNARWQRRERLPAPSQPVVYIVEEEPEPAGGLEILRDIDLSQWGWS